MSTSETVRAWSNTSASDATADSAISSSDSQSPDTLDNNVRSIMAAVHKNMDDLGGALTAGGSANALTVTTKQVLESGQLVAGLRVLLKAASTNTTAAVTFAPDGLTAVAIKRADGTALNIGSIQAGAFLDLVYNTGTSEWWAANIPPAAVAGGIVLLTSGTWSAQATGDIVLSTYGGYRGFKFFLSGVQPVNNNVILSMRLSANAGVSYDSGANNYTYMNIINGNVGITTQDTLIALDTNATTNTSTCGADAEVTLLNAAAASLFPRLAWSIWLPLTSSVVGLHTGVGIRATAQITNAVRFLFSAGNISVGNYAVYGLV